MAAYGKSLVLIVLLLVTILASAVASDALINELLPYLYQKFWHATPSRPVDWSRTAIAGVGAAVFIAVLIFLAHLRKRWFTATAELVPENGPIARKIVIMGLSPADGLSALINQAKSLSQGQAVTLAALRNFVQTQRDAANDTGDFRALDELESLIKIGLDEASLNLPGMVDKGMITTTPSSWPRATEKCCGATHKWVQNLRALRNHILGTSTLKMVVIVPSEKTIAQARIFREFLLELFSKIMEPDIRVEVMEINPPNYDDFLSVQNALNYAVRHATQQLRQAGDPVTSKDICIDSTSGKATFSIGAALVTLNQDLLYSYVTTFETDPAPEGGDVKFYDAQIDLSAFVED